MADTMTAKNIFIAFTGPKIDQQTATHQIAGGYECWDLTRSQLENFIPAIQGRIPPVNENVLRNYKTDPENLHDSFGISDEQFKQSSWGLLLPDTVPGALVNGYADILFLLNLYSPHFLYPVFYVSDFGIFRPDHHKDYRLYFHDQKQANRFGRTDFVKFYEALISESVYGSWQADRMSRWNVEDWRLFVACLLFTELKTYENSKYPFTWQRESADMATILEALFTAGGGTQSEVGYKLRKRLAALMGFQFPSIEQEIKELYKQRSAFVHGSFFLRAKKDIEIQDGLASLPSPPFQFLYEQKEHIRHALVAYLYLDKIRKSRIGEFNEYRNVLEVLEQSIIDLDLRAAVRKHAKAILDLM